MGCAYEERVVDLNMEMHILELSKLGRTEDILKAAVENHKRQEKILFPLAIRAGYHFSNHDHIVGRPRER